MSLRFIDDNYWKDPFVCNLDAEGKLLYTYCIHNPQQKPHGIFIATPNTIAFDIGVTKEKVISLLKQFEAEGKIKWIEGASKIWTKKFICIQTKNPKYHTGLLACLKKETRELQQEYIQYYNDLGFWEEYKIDISELRDRNNADHKKGKG